jgi:hypothetical protein
MSIMLPLYRGNGNVPPLVPPKIPPHQPDYAELANLLNTFMPPNNLGEFSISGEEAASLRKLGWSARGPGIWRAPTLPWEAVSLFRTLWLLADHIDPASRPCPWNPRRAAFVGVYSTADSLGQLDHRILKLLDKAPGHVLSRTHLQRRLWRIPATIFHHALDRLIAQDRITVYDGLLYPFSRQQCELHREMAARPRHPVPLSTMP